MSREIQSNFRQSARETAIEGISRQPEKSCKRLGKILASVSSAVPEVSSLVDASRGSAISPVSARNCLYKDIPRTVGFLQAGYDAITAAMAKFPERPIRVLEAGSGPYATLSMILASLFEEGDVEFIALDIFEESIKCAYKIAKTLGQSGKFSNFIVGDATTISLAMMGIKPPHVVLCETMTPGLQVEPQVAIMANFGDQMVEGGFFIPEEVRLSLGTHKPFSSQFKEIGEVYRLNKEITGRVKNAGIIDGEFLRREQEIDITFDLPPELATIKRLALQTRLKLFGDKYLEPDKSLITGSLAPFLEEDKRNAQGHADWARVQLILGVSGSLPLRLSLGSRENTCEGNGNSLNFDRFLQRFIETAGRFMPPGYP